MCLAVFAATVESISASVWRRTGDLARLEPPPTYRVPVKVVQSPSVVVDRGAPTDVLRLSFAYPITSALTRRHNFFQSLRGEFHNGIRQGAHRAGTSW